MTETALLRSSVDQIGPYPPPYGGVSVHIKRLHRRLRLAGVRSRVFCDPQWSQNEDGVVPRRVITHRPLCYLNWLFEPGWPVTASIIHLHYSWGPYSPTLWLMLLKQKQLVITVHNQIEHHGRGKLSALQRIAAWQIVRSTGVQWIAVSEMVSGQLQECGVPGDRIAVIPAYLPPEPLLNPALSLPAECVSFTAAHSPIISTYGFRLWLDESGIDIYGFDLCIEMVRALKTEYPRIGLIVCIPQIGLADYLDELKSRISRYGIEENILFITEPIEEAHALWQLSDIYLRATVTDGDAVAIREALALGTPAVASDATRRPEGVTLFENRELRSLLAAVRKALNIGRHRNSFLKGDDSDNYVHLVRVYEKFSQP